MAFLCNNDLAMASSNLNRTSLHALPRPPRLQSRPFSSTRKQSHFTIRAPISCSSSRGGGGKKPVGAALASEFAVQVEKLNTEKSQKQEAMKKSRDVLFSEICKSADLKEEEMRNKWRRMEEEERWGFVKEFVGNWGLRFHPLSARSVKEMIEESVNEDDGSSSHGGSSFIPRLKRLMGFSEEDE